MTTLDLDNVAELKALRARLVEARSSGTRRVTYIANGVERTIEMRSDMELKAALADIEQRIAALDGKPSVSRFIFAAKKVSPDLDERKNDMAKNFVQPGSTVTMIAPAGGVLSGQAVLFDSLFGVVAYDAIEGAEVEVTVDGVWELPKSATAITAGQPVYFDEALGVIKGASAVGLFRVGAATEAAAADAPTVRVRLDGVSVEAVA